MVKYQYIKPFDQEEFSFHGAHCFTLGEKSFLLSREGTSVILPRCASEELEKGSASEEVAFKLFQRGFAAAHGQERFPKEADPIRPTLFMIDFTTKCNCNCIYCLRHFENVGESISEEMLDRITDYIISYCLKYKVRNISFQPWGGEPLLETEKILHCKHRFDESGIRADFNIQTNGLSLTLDRYRLLKENGIHLGVSIDGLAEVHDAHRLDVRGNKTHAKIVENLREIISFDPDHNIGTLSVNSAHSIDRIKEDVDYIVNTLGIPSLKFNLVHPSGSESFDESLIIGKDRLPEYISRVLEAVLEQLREGRNCYESNLADKTLNLLGVPNDNMCDSKGCRGGISFLSFDREGNVYPCEMIGREEMKLGNIAEGKDPVELILAAQAANPYYAPRKVEGCENCPFFPFCRGGCKACSLAYGKEACEVDEVECTVNKTLYPLLIELILTDPETAEKLIGNRYHIKA